MLQHHSDRVKMKDGKRKKLVCLIVYPYRCEDGPTISQKQYYKIIIILPLISFGTSLDSSLLTKRMLGRNKCCEGDRGVSGV